MGKGIGRICKYEQRKCPYPYPNTTFVIPKFSGTSIHTQINSSSCDSMGEHDLAYARLYQSTNHHGNTDLNDNDDSQSFETPR